MTTQLSTSIRTKPAFWLPMAWLKKAGWAAGVVLLVWLARGPIGEFLAIMKDREGLLAAVEGYGFLAPVLLFLLLSLQVFVGFIPGHALMFVTGYLYGPLWGSLITVSATTLSAQLAFLIARRAGRPLIYRLASRELVQKWEKLSGGKEVLFYFFSFILPVFPSDLMSYVAGLGTISTRNFMYANLAARVPVGIFLTLLGVYTFRLPVELWIAAGLFLLAAVIGYAVSRARGRS
jgi:uncharacterized membrane protein YdjX (TVP38/TMEM64 family)